MRHYIGTQGQLVITCTPEEQAEIQELIDQKLELLRCDIEVETLEGMIANSELQWIPEGSTGDITSAPMLGVLGECIRQSDQMTVPAFGFISAGYWDCSEQVHPIIARWAYMDYQVKSFLDDLARHGRCEWQGGYADKEAIEEPLGESQEATLLRKTQQYLTEINFWKKQFTRARCGCVAADCIRHGAYDPADVARLAEEGALTLNPVS